MNPAGVLCSKPLRCICFCSHTHLLKLICSIENSWAWLVYCNRCCQRIIKKVQNKIRKKQNEVAVQMTPKFKLSGLYVSTDDTHPRSPLRSFANEKYGYHHIIDLWQLLPVG